MQVEAHKQNEIHCHRYLSDDATYALVISHGLAGVVNAQKIGLR